MLAKPIAFEGDIYPPHVRGGKRESPLFQERGGRERGQAQQDKTVAQRASMRSTTLSTESEGQSVGGKNKVPCFLKVRSQAQQDKTVTQRASMRSTTLSTESEGQFPI